MYTIYGIPNCDVIKKATTWFQANKIPYKFHDYKKEGISAEKLISWCTQQGWEIFLNKRSTTWKELGGAVQSGVRSQESAIVVMQEHNSIIKRPVIEKNGKVVAVGFDEKKYGEML